MLFLFSIIFCYVFKNTCFLCFYTLFLKINGIPALLLCSFLYSCLCPLKILRFLGLYPLFQVLGCYKIQQKFRIRPITTISHLACQQNKSKIEIKTWTAKSGCGLFIGYGKDTITMTFGYDCFYAAVASDVAFLTFSISSHSFKY